MSNINNLTVLNKFRPTELRGETDEQYFGQIELWIKQVTDLLRGVNDTQSFTVATLPPATDYDPSVNGFANFVYVSDETGGAQMAFSDGTNWRRFTDRAIVS